VPRSVLLVYGIVLVSALIALRRPIVGLAVYHALGLVRPQDMLWMTLSDSRLSVWIGLGVAAGWLWQRVSRERPPEPVAWQTVLIVCFLALKALSAVVASNTEATFNHLQIVAKLVVFYGLTVSLIETRREFRLITTVVACCLGVLGIWGNWQWYVVGIPGGVTGELAGPGWEVEGAFADRTTFGSVLSIGIPFCLFVCLAEGRVWARWPLLACIPLLMNAVMLTFGRAAMLTMLAVLGWSVWRLRQPWLVAVGVLAGILLVYRLAGPEVVDRLRTVEAYSEEPSAAGRIEVWKAALPMIADHPLFGVGPGHFPAYSLQYNPDARQGRVVHNEFLETAAESGLPAVVLLLLIMGGSLVSLRRIRKLTWARPETRWAYYYATLLETIIIAYGISAMFASLPYFELFYLSVALTVALKRLLAREVLTVPAILEPGAGRERGVAAARGVA
jgi:putative inorganic carbon (hco3(-)) transporter